MRKGVIMHKISRFAVWICSKFTKTEIEFLVKNYQIYSKIKIQKLSQKTILKKNIQIIESSIQIPTIRNCLKKIVLDYKNLLETYEKEHNHPLKPVNIRNSENRAPEHCVCYTCKDPGK